MHECLEMLDPAIGKHEGKEGRGAGGRVRWLLASTGSLCRGGHPIKQILLKDNYGWGGGEIQSRNFLRVGPGHSLVRTSPESHWACGW